MKKKAQGTDAISFDTQRRHNPMLADLNYHPQMPTPKHKEYCKRFEKRAVLSSTYIKRAGCHYSTVATNAAASTSPKVTSA